MLGGRITVKMTGNFTPGMSFTLLYADDGLNQSRFDVESIMPPSGGPCFTRESIMMRIELSLIS
jgi:hypothetical protein